MLEDTTDNLYALEEIEENRLVGRMHDADSGIVVKTQDYSSNIDKGVLRLLEFRK